MKVSSVLQCRHLQSLFETSNRTFSSLRFYDVAKCWKENVEKNRREQVERIDIQRPEALAANLGASWLRDPVPWFRWTKSMFWLVMHRPRFCGL
jgi:hypothetical protein